MVYGKKSRKKLLQIVTGSATIGLGGTVVEKTIK